MKKVTIAAVLICLALLFSVPVNAQVIDPGESREFPLPSSGFGSADDPVLGDSYWSWNAETGWLEVSSVIVASILDKGWAEATLTAPFRVSGSKPRNIGAVVTGNAEWEGVIFAGGIGGTLTEITITASLWDKTTSALAGSTTLLNKSCEGLFLEACLKSYNSSTDFNFNAAVVRGHDYELRLTARCEVESGLIGAGVECVFIDLDGGHVGWNGMTVTLEDDVIGLLEDLKAGQEELKAGQVELIIGQEELKAGQVELIIGQEELKAGQEVIKKLLITPEGRRPGWNKDGY